MIRRLSILFLITFLPIVSAQLTIPTEFSTFPEIIYFLIIPAVSTFAFILGFMGKISPPAPGKIKALIPLIITVVLIFSGILTSIVNTLSQIDYYLPIFLFIILFFIGINTYMRSKTYRVTKKRISRKNLPKLISQTEKSIDKIEKEIDRLGYLEKQLEAQYAAVKDESYRKSLEKVRKQRSMLASRRDRLVQERKMMKRMHRESVES